MPHCFPDFSESAPSSPCLWCCDSTCPGHKSLPAGSAMELHPSPSPHVSPKPEPSYTPFIGSLPSAGLSSLWFCLRIIFSFFFSDTYRYGYNKECPIKLLTQIWFSVREMLKARTKQNVVWMAWSVKMQLKCSLSRCSSEENTWTTIKSTRDLAQYVAVIRHQCKSRKKKPI